MKGKCLQKFLFDCSVTCFPERRPIFVRIQDKLSLLTSYHATAGFLQRLINFIWRRILISFFLEVVKQLEIFQTLEEKKQHSVIVLGSNLFGALSNILVSIIMTIAKCPFLNLKLKSLSKVKHPERRKLKIDKRKFAQINLQCVQMLLFKENS